MKPILDRTELERLRLLDSELGQSVEISPCDPSEQGQGLTARGEATLEAVTGLTESVPTGETETGIGFRRLETVEVDSSGFLVYRHGRFPRFYLFVLERGEPAVRTWGETGGAVLPVRQSVFLDATRLRQPLALVDESRGAGLVIDARGAGGLAIQEFYPRLPIPTPPHIASDLEEWCARAGDPWLLERVRERLAAGDPLSHAIAAGMAARLLCPPPDKRRELFQELRETRRDSVFDRWCEWAEAQSEDAKRGIEGLACAAAAILHEELRETADTPRPDQEDWRTTLYRLLRTRDELEGVRALLGSARADGRLDRVLARLDEDAWFLVRSLPSWKGPAGDEHLRRALSVCPAAWWVFPVGGDL
ncbi:MAG: hypothetical protein HY720_03345 [Planctomycetes bacterium]|nr:hypothetical protein [Planctomycetota bacterium]